MKSVACQTERVYNRSLATFSCKRRIRAGQHSAFAVIELHPDFGQHTLRFPVKCTGTFCWLQRRAAALKSRFYHGIGNQVLSRASRNQGLFNTVKVGQISNADTCLSRRQVRNGLRAEPALARVQFS